MQRRHENAQKCENALIICTLFINKTVVSLMAVKRVLKYNHRSSVH